MSKQIQYVLDIGVEIQREVHGVEMGVLENGVPFLTQTGLAKLVGVSRSVISDLSAEWEAEYENEVTTKDRIAFLRRYLFERGYDQQSLYIETIKNGTTHYAYPDVVCMAVLEYYAFEAKQSNNSIALTAYRSFAAGGMQQFIYDAVGYKPKDDWQYYKDRVSILNNAVPEGYFSIFHETSGLSVDLINNGLPVNDKTIPDISIGLAWSKFWNDNNMSSKYGDRIHYNHYYPSYYPQAASNPQAASAYPIAALGEFRAWFKREYLPTKFPKYLLTKAHLLGGQAEAKRIGSVFSGAAALPSS